MVEERNQVIVKWPPPLDWGKWGRTAPGAVDSMKLPITHFCPQCGTLLINPYSKKKHHHNCNPERDFTWAFYLLRRMAHLANKEQLETIINPLLLLYRQGKRNEALLEMIIEESKAFGL